ncbi:MAG: AMP-binding protein [Deltaproteobacteria bacterium]|nr:AMP-binding protein [Deltaproteobacteria bacterium]
MSLTVVQRFYELAKQQAEAPALGLWQDGEYHALPWWFVKSKAKHFGLGLLEEGAREGEYFYLIASPHPTWSYAELGALTMGLRTVPLPAELSSERLETLFRRYPPAFFFTEARAFAPLRSLCERSKGLRRVILPEEPEGGPEGLARSFRRVFNAGIRFESKHHAAYRRIRQGLAEDREMSPLRVAPDGSLEERPLRYGEVNEACAKLSHALGAAKARRLLSTADLSRSFARVACLYWPIFAALQSVFAPRGEALGPLLRRFRPEALFLSGPWLEAKAGEDPGKAFAFAAEREKGLGWLARRRLRARLGGRLRCLIGDTTPAPAWVRAAVALRLPALVAKPETPNFLL